MPESRTNLVKGIRREGLSVPLSGPLQVPPTMGDRSKSLPAIERGVSLGARTWAQGPCLSLAYLTLPLTFATLLPVIRGDSFCFSCLTSGRVLRPRGGLNNLTQYVGPSLG